MKQTTIDLTREELESLLDDRQAYKFTISLTMDGFKPQYTIFSHISSTMDRDENEWIPMTKMQADCELIIRAACEATGITFMDVLSTCRKRFHSIARKIIIYEAYRRFGHIYPSEKIGKMVGRDHTYVIYVRNNFDAGLKYDSELKNVYDAYLKNIERLEKEYVKCSSVQF